MKHIYCTSVVIIGLLVGCLASFAFGGEIAAPTWQAGHSWTVKAVYRQYGPDREWSTPVFWKYQIGESVTLDGEPCMAVAVNSVHPGPELAARLLFRASDFSLVQAELAKTRRGKTVSQTLSYTGGAPVKTEQTLIPFDMPVFPLVPPSEAGFAVQKPVGQDMILTENLRQTTRIAINPEGAIDTQGKPLQGAYTRVECLTPDNASLFLQYWQEGLPWPVYGRNADMQYWFVGEEQ